MPESRNPQNLARAIFVSSAALMAIAVFMKAAGYLEKRLLGSGFGVGDRLDAYVLALKIALTGYFVLRGVMRPALTPVLTAIKNRSVGEARRFGLSLAAGLGGLLALLTVAGMAFAPQLVRFSASGFSPAKQAECVHLTRWLLPMAALMALASLMGVSLQVRKRFAAAAAGEFLQKCILILGIALLAAPLGLSGVVAAQWASVLALFCFYAFSHRAFVHFSGPSDPPNSCLREIAWLAWPVAVGSLVSQFGRLAQARFASEMEPGSVTAVAFAQTVIDLPLNLLPLSISVVLLPYFSEFSDKKEMERSSRYLGHSMRLLLLIFVPAAAYLFLFRTSVVQLLFSAGRFDQQATALTAEAICGLAPGLPFFAVEMVIMNYFYASRRMVTPLVCGLIATTAAIVLLPWLSAAFGLAGISGYLTLARIAKLVLLGACLYQIGVRPPARAAARFFGKLACALAIAAAVSAAVFGLSGIGLSGPAPLATLPFIGISASLAAAYLMAVFALGFEECRWAVEAVRRRLFPERSASGSASAAAISSGEGAHAARAD